MSKIIQLSHWLAQFPYENLSKRLHGHPRESSRVVEEQEHSGAGGTCFSLVNLAAQKAKSIGLEPAFYLGNRPKGENRHCVIGFPQEEVFIDPGYLFYRPNPLDPETHKSIVYPQNTLHIEPLAEKRLKIQTERKGQKTWRYTLKSWPVSRDQFEEAWKDSFTWSGVMDSVVMTRLYEDEMFCYLNGELESITREKRNTIELPDPPRRFTDLSEIFGVNSELLRRFETEIQNTQ